MSHTGLDPGLAGCEARGKSGAGIPVGPGSEGCIERGSVPTPTDPVVREEPEACDLAHAAPDDTVGPDGNPEVSKGTSGEASGSAMGAASAIVGGAGGGASSIA